MVNIRIDTTDTGDQKLKKKIKIVTNDPENKREELVVVGRVERFVYITPSRLRLSGKAGASLEKKLKIKVRSEYPFTIIGIKAEKNKVDCRIVNSGKEGTYTIIVRARLKEKGRYKDTIVIKTTNKDKPEIRIPVSGRIR